MSGSDRGRPGDKIEQALRKAADLFHEIVAASEARRLLDQEGYKLPQGMYDDFTRKLRTSPEIMKIATDGFERCVLALAEMGAADVAIHSCGAQALDEQSCTGTIVHDEFTACPVHDRRAERRDR